MRRLQYFGLRGGAQRRLKPRISPTLQHVVYLLFLTFCYNVISSTCSFTRYSRTRSRFNSRAVQKTEFSTTKKSTVNNLLLLNYASTTANITLTTKLPTKLPNGFPNEWSDGVIPFAYNFFSPGIKWLKAAVKRGHRFIEEQSCLVFEERHPHELASIPNKTYLYYEYSGALENCCASFFSEPVGRRVLLITPTCSTTEYAAHVTLHGLGLFHIKYSGIPVEKAISVLFFNECPDIKSKRKVFHERLRDMATRFPEGD